MYVMLFLVDYRQMCHLNDKNDEKNPLPPLPPSRKRELSRQKGLVQGTVSDDSHGQVRVKAR